jgi:hypothetical protein
VFPTLQQPEPIAKLLCADEELETATDNAVIPVTPIACESFVSDAMWHIFCGFLVMENLDTTAQSQCGSAELELTTEDMCTVLKGLNDCSIGFWRLAEARMPAAARLRELGSPFKRRRGAPGNQCSHRALGGHAVEMNRREQSARRFETQGPGAVSKSKRDESFALAILHLVGAYRAMEVLSASAFPSGAPDSFELACRCLCTALVTLDACLASCVD